MILGIDLGQKTTGLAISEGTFASPYTTIKHQSPKEALQQVVKICNDQNINKIVIGFVEGKIKGMFEKFAQDLQKEKPDLQIILCDETLTSRQATLHMIKLGIAKRRRKIKEHQIAAALILQSYLDANLSE